MINIPFGKTTLPLDVPAENLQGVYTSQLNHVTPPADQHAVVLKVLANPIASPKLSELAKNARNCVLIASDHTRPVPSKYIVPHMLDELRQGNPNIQITILIATGTHRSTTRDELVAKFGEPIVDNETIVVHDSLDEAAMTTIGTLPSGGTLSINKLAAETDLLIAEGFIEPHFFAGFSGGRKSVLPGIASYPSVLANHCAQFIASPFARTGKLDGNPIQTDMLWAAKQAKLAFIVNVVINAEKHIMSAVAGNPFDAHAQGCQNLAKLCKLQIPLADIVVTSNGGYPLDQNLYQAVKGMTAAEAAAKPDAIIIMSAKCNDGHGGESFFQTLAEAPSFKELYDRLCSIPMDKTIPEQWEAQILARILAKHRLILVAEPQFQPALDQMHIEYADDLNAALKTALNAKGNQATVAVIPDGVSVIVN